MFTYDTENRLIGASGAKNANLIYDPLGRLYETNDGAGGNVTRFLYDGNALVAEYNSSGTITARYVHGSGVDQPIVWYDGSTVNSSTRRHLFANWQAASQTAQAIPFTSTSMIGGASVTSQFGDTGVLTATCQSPLVGC